MAYKPRHLMTLFLPALLLAGFAVSCTDTDVLPDAGTPSIDFGTPALTRGVVTSDADMDVFDVWGWYKPTEGSETATDTQVFNATPVTKKGDSWKYDNPQRWQPGNTYRFYAVYPSGLDNIDVSSSGEIKISIYNATANHDLMIANQTVSYASDAIRPPRKVSFQFKHIMANIVFAARTAPAVSGSGQTMTITSFKLTGFPVTGSYNSGNVPAWSVSTPQNERYSSTDPVELTGTDYTDLVSLLVFPQLLGTVEGSSLRYEIVYEDANQNKYESSGRLQAVSGDLSQWQEGKRYRYTMDLGADYILFGTPQVEEWDEMSGGRWNVE